MLLKVSVKDERFLSIVHLIKITQSKMLINYTSMKIEPNGSKPPNRVIINGSVYHFFSGIGLGTALMRHG